MLHQTKFSCLRYKSECNSNDFEQFINTISLECILVFSGQLLIVNGCHSCFAMAGMLRKT